MKDIQFQLSEEQVTALKEWHLSTIQVRDCRTALSGAETRNLNACNRVGNNFIPKKLLAEGTPIQIEIAISGGIICMQRSLNSNQFEITWRVQPKEQE